MARARLLGHVQRVTVEPINRANTQVDELAGEPFTNIARDAQVVARCQLDTSRENDRSAGQGGARRKIQGAITFLTRELRGVWEPADGDRIVLVADEDGSNARVVNWYLRGTHFQGKTRRGNELIVADVTDRQPARASSEGLY